MAFDHTTRKWSVLCKARAFKRTLYWNGVGWTDEEKFAALMTEGDANDAVTAIKAMPPLRLSFCDDPEKVRLIH